MSEYHPPLTGVQSRFEEEIAREARKITAQKSSRRQNANPSGNPDHAPPGEIGRRLENSLRKH
jgi:hypothetical protein